MTSQIELPELDEEIALGEAEDFASMQADIASGKVKTFTLDELDEGIYDIEIQDCRVVTSKAKDGETVKYPNLLWGIREVNDAWSINAYWPISHGKPAARRFFNKRNLTTFIRLLGADYSKVAAPQTTDLDPTEVLAAKCDYFNALGAQVVGKKVRMRVERNDEGYNQVTFLA